MGKTLIERRDSFSASENMFTMKDVSLPEHGHVAVPVMKGDFSALPTIVQEFIAENVSGPIWQIGVCVW